MTLAEYLTMALGAGISRRDAMLMEISTVLGIMEVKAEQAERARRRDT